MLDECISRNKRILEKVKARLDIATTIQRNITQLRAMSDHDVRMHNIQYSNSSSRYDSGRLMLMGLRNVVVHGDPRVYDEYQSVLQSIARLEAKYVNRTMTNQEWDFIYNHSPADVIERLYAIEQLEDQLEDRPERSTCILDSRLADVNFGVYK